MSAYTGDVTVVTEHGWADFMTNWGGHSPSMVVPDRTSPGSRVG